MHDRHRRHFTRSAAAVAVSVGFVPTALRAQDKGGPLPAIGADFPLPRLTMLDGTVREPADADGKILVLYWWASWCPFCALQSPEMEKLWRARSSAGLKLLGLSIDRKADTASDYLRRKGYTFPSVWVSPELARALPKPKGLPVTIVKGRDGKVIQAEQGQMFAEDVELIGRWLDV